jgi:hypothetical protein
MKVLIRPIFHHVLKTAACFPLNLRPILSMLQCSKWLDLEAFETYDPGPAATFPQLGFADLRRFAGDADQAVEEPVGIFCTVPVIR